MKRSNAPLFYYSWSNNVNCQSIQATIPSGIFLPGTELLQSPFRMEFSTGSRSRQYRWSLRCHCRFLRNYRQFLRSYRRSLRRCCDPWGDRWAPIVARLAKHQKTLLNIVKHHETHVKHREPLVNHHETLKTLWNIMKQSSFDATISTFCGDVVAGCGDVVARCRDVVARCGDVVARCRDVGARRGDVDDHAELPVISPRSFQRFRRLPNN